MPKLSVYVICVVWALGLTSCESTMFKGTPADSPAAVLGEWPFRPSEMRVHPFTALSHDQASGQTTLNVRIELIDIAGDVTKDAGTFRFELYAISPKASRTGNDQRLYLWEAPILTLEQNKKHYDPITRTYLFHLTLAENAPQDQKLELRVQFDATSGARILCDALVQ